MDQEPTSVSIRLKIKYVEPTCRYVRWEIQYQHDQLLGFRFSCIVFFFFTQEEHLCFSVLIGMCCLVSYTWPQQPELDKSYTEVLAHSPYAIHGEDV